MQPLELAHVSTPVRVSVFGSGAVCLVDILKRIRRQKAERSHELGTGEVLGRHERFRSA
jgi:hypothetical protein